MVIHPKSTVASGTNGICPEAEKQTVEYKSYAGMIFQSFKNVAHTSLT